MISRELEAVASEVLAASDYTKVFGLPDAHESTESYVKRRFRKLQTKLHPDRYIDHDAKQLATAAFSKTTQFHEDAQTALLNKRYGHPPTLVTMASPKGKHTVHRALGTADLSSMYSGESDMADGKRQTFVKVVKDHRNNDLMKTEAKALRLLYGPDTEAQWRPYVSELIDSFVYAEPGKPRRQTNVLTRLDGFLSLEEIRARFPHGVPVLHGIWMWRRLLAALAFAHDNGVVHGAVLPGHVMVQPAQHGVVLVDWCYASIKEDDAFPPLVALVDRFRDWYPAEVLAKQAPSPATDIALAVRTIIYLLGGNPVTGVLPDTIPRQLRAFFKGCLQLNQSARPQNAWLLLQEFDELLERLGGSFYPRRFREFVVPAGTTK